LADIPGLIEGAHEGVGLGHEFLRHVERTKMLIHVLDVSGMEGRNPIEDFEQINEELSKYNPELAKREQVVACNKMDLPDAQEKYSEVEKTLIERGYKVFAISAATNKGLSALMSYVATRIEIIEKIPLVKDEEDNVEYKYEKEQKSKISVQKVDGKFVISGKPVDKLMASTNFEDPDSLKYFQKTLRRWGTIDELKALDIEDGDIVKINDFEFEYYD
jgi:GTPase